MQSLRSCPYSYQTVIITCILYNVENNVTFSVINSILTKKKMLLALRKES